MSVSEYVMEFHEGSQPRFGIGQPVWQQRGDDHRTYIVHRYVKPRLIEVVMENDLTGPIYLAHEDYFCDTPPPTKNFHPEHRGTIYFTGTGNPLKAIQGGFPELRGAL